MSVSGALTRIGRYQVEDLVGEGASARVFRARDPQIGRMVAIKLLKHRAGTDQTYLDRFRREAKSAGTLSHPNIVTIFDVGDFEDGPYITMEFLEESSIEELLANGSRLSLKRVLSISAQLASALDYPSGRSHSYPAMLERCPKPRER
jgi:serine/threonine-protein kinase